MIFGIVYILVLKYDQMIWQSDHRTDNRIQNGTWQRQSNTTLIKTVGHSRSSRRSWSTNVTRHIAYVRPKQLTSLFSRSHHLRKVDGIETNSTSSVSFISYSMWAISKQLSSHWIISWDNYFFSGTVSLWEALVISLLFTEIL